MKRAALWGASLCACLIVSPAWAEDCTPNIQDISSQVFQPDGTTANYPERSTRHCLLDGAMQMDEFRSLNPQGQPVFWGVSFQNTDPVDGISHTLWVMVGDPSYTIIINHHNEDGSLTSTGHGFDASGEFLERSTTTYLEDGSSIFEMGRSFDGGNTWIDPTNLIRATIADGSPPALPEALAPPFQEGADALPEDFPRGMPIHDGTAEVRAFERDGSYLLQFASRYWAPNRWRMVEWVVGSDEISITEVAF